MSTMTVSSGLGRAAYRGAASSGPRAASTHLTRRGRLLLSLLALVLLVTGAVLLSGGASALAGTDRASAGAATAQRVTVRPGETLWQIAERVAPGTDPRETVARILDLNDLQTAQVQVGTALVLPQP
jgi:nucleoid-associated protein YgaU